MCWFRKYDIYVTGVRADGVDGTMTLLLRTTPDGKDYEDRFTLERALVGGGSEVVFTIPFSDVTDVTFDRTSSESVCTIRFDLRTGDDRLKDLKVSKMCFNHFDLKKMIRICKEHNETSLS